MNKFKYIAMLSVAALFACGAFAADAVSKPLFEDGRFEFGVNYWASETATRMWRDWRPESIEKDLATLEAHGVTVLRVFPTWSDFQPIVEIHAAGNRFADQKETRFTLDELPLPDTPAGRAGVDEKMLGRFAEFCDMAERHGMKLIVPILTGHMTFRLFLPPALENRDPQSDPVALEWEAKFIECFVNALKGKKAIAAWESGNETRWFGDIQSRAQAAVWLRYIHNQIRLADPTRPVIGVDGMNVIEPKTKPKWHLNDIAELSDWVPHHLYGNWSRRSPDAIDSVRDALFVASRNAAVEAMGGKPTFNEEHGIRYAEIASPEKCAQYLRGALWNCWAANIRAMVWWCAFDQDNQTCAPYEWPEPCLELGLFRSNRAPYPSAGAAAAFARFAASQPALPKAKPDAVFIVPDEEMVHATCVLARQAGIMPDWQAPDGRLKDAKTYFLPSVKERGFMTASGWNALRAKVENGATLYLSLDESCFLPGLAALCRMQVVSRTSAPQTVKADFGGFSLSLRRPTSPVYESVGAEVLAKDGNGSPIFFRNRYGKGTVYTLCLPLERLLHGAVGGYDCDAWRIYKTVLDVPQLFSAGSRDVMASVHRESDSKAFVVVVNNSPRPFEGRPAVADGWRVTASATDAPERASVKDGTLRLDANSGILLTVEANSNNRK